jgi:hypothetical protein
MLTQHDLTDLTWIQELDSRPTMALDRQQTHTTIWVHFVTEAEALSKKLDEINLGEACIDVNVGSNCFNWKPLELLEKLPEGYREYRYILAVDEKF